MRKYVVRRAIPKVIFGVKFVYPYMYLTFVIESVSCIPVGANTLNKPLQHRKVLEFGQNIHNLHPDPHCISHVKWFLLDILLTVCSLGIMSFCDFGYFLWFRGRDFGFDCTSAWSLFTFLLSISLNWMFDCLECLVKVMWLTLTPVKQQKQQQQQTNTEQFSA